jgi:P27 family predicted phage terminase small subunit
MTKTGRKPHETIDVMPFGANSRRLQPPDCLAELQKRAFVDLITSVPRSQFRPSDLPLLARYAELVVMAETAAFHLGADGMVIADDKGRTRVNPWFTIYRDTAKELRVLSQRLRLDPKARTKKAPKTLPESTSYYETMRLQGDFDDVDAH